ncbi:hypothetical protein ACUN90_22130 [Escherichia sp. SP-MK2]
MMWLFRQGRVVIETPGEQHEGMPSGLLPLVQQPLADDPCLQAVFEEPRVIQRAGGLSGLDAWLGRNSTTPAIGAISGVSNAFTPSAP